MKEVSPKKKEAIRQVRVREGLPPNLLPLLENIFEAREAVLKEISVPCLLEEGAKVRDRAEDGVPLLDSSSSGWIPAPIHYFRKILEVVSSLYPQEIAALKNLLNQQVFSAEEMILKILRGKIGESDLLQQLGPPGSLLYFLLAESLRPFLETLGSHFRDKINYESWTQGYCPFCGGIPAMGEIREEGRRVLHCPLCTTQWNYPRLKCPYCANEDQEKLTYFQMDGEEIYRVDVCLVCTRYLKTIDSRERAESPDMEIEDYLTLHLDQFAQQEGYNHPDKLLVEIS